MKELELGVTEDFVRVHSLCYYHADGNLSWLENLILSLFKNKIKKQAQSAISKAIASTIDQELNVLLQSQKLKFPYEGTFPSLVT